MVQLIGFEKLEVIITYHGYEAEFDDIERKGRQKWDIKTL